MFARERVPLLARHADETVGGVELGDSSGRGEAVPGTDVLTTVATVDVGCEFASGNLGEWAAVLNALVGEAEVSVERWGLVENRAESAGRTGIDAAVAIATGVVVVEEGERLVVVVEGQGGDYLAKEEAAAGMGDDELVVAPDEPESCLTGPVAFEYGYGVDTEKPIFWGGAEDGP